jgi:Fe-S-cluster-containing hydrogenase component 2
MAEENMTEEESKELKEPRSYSRRRFLFGSGLVVGGAVAAGVAGSALAPTKVEAGGGETAVAPSMDQACVQNAQAPLQKAMGYVSFDPAQCAGCSTCMAVCSLFHDGVVNPELARIQVVAPVMEIFQVTGTTCKQCEGPECLYACPTGALHVDPQTGARVIDQNVCIGCQRCIKACPQYPNSPIRFNAETKKSLKCDLCGGDPQCVKFCTKSSSIYSTKVLTFVKKEA